MRALLYYCDHHEIPLPAGTQVSDQEIRLLRRRLEATGLFDLQPAPLAELANILRVHDEPYARAFIDGAIPIHRTGKTPFR